MHTNSTNQFLMKWVSITVLGWYSAQAIGIFVTHVAYPKAELAILPSSPLYYGTFGLLFGVSQGICLYRRIPNSLRWIIATAIGFFVAALILKSLNRFEITNSFLREFPLLAYFFGGAVLGFAQYQTIKKTVQKAKWWTIVVAISWVIAQAFIAGNGAAIDFLGILVFTMITGLVFIRLVPNPSSKTQHA
jgi:hypothetical protein